MYLIDISIIIVNYNTKKLISNCIKSIYDQVKDVLYEIIVVDNASTDDSIKTIKKTFPDILVIDSNENIGFGRANNLGTKYAKGEFLFFLNPDTILLNNAPLHFLQFYKHYDSMLSIGALGSVLLDKKCKINASYSLKYSTFYEDIFNSIYSSIFKNTKRKEKHLLKNDYLKVAWVSGANLFIKKDIFLKADGFDENYFLYYEEVDLQRRLKFNKYESFVISEPKIIHLEGKSFDRSISIEKKKIIDRSKFYYYRKYTSPFIYIINKFLYKLLSIKVYFNYGLKKALEYISYLNTLI
jgi:hypothetical protein